MEIISYRLTRACVVGYRTEGSWDPLLASGLGVIAQGLMISVSGLGSVFSVLVA